MTTPNEELRARLPELPGPAARFHVQHFMQNPGMRNTELCEVQDFGQGSHSLYTAEQLQDYAIAALARQEEGREAVDAGVCGAPKDGRDCYPECCCETERDCMYGTISPPIAALAPHSGGEVPRYKMTLEREGRAFGYYLEPDPNGDLCKYAEAKRALWVSALAEVTTPAPQAAGVSEADATKWMPVKPEGAPYWGIHTADGETIVGTSSGLSERDAQLICDAVNGDLPTAHDDLTLELVEVTEERDHLRRTLARNANAARAEIAEAALRQIRDSTFRSALQLRAIADRALAGPFVTPQHGEVDVSLSVAAAVPGDTAQASQLRWLLEATSRRALAISEHDQLCNLVGGLYRSGYNTGRMHSAPASPQGVSDAVELLRHRLCNDEDAWRALLVVMNALNYGTAAGAAPEGITKCGHSKYDPCRNCDAPQPGAQHGQECQHADTRTGYDSVTCTNCGAFKTDSQWGIARNRWFRSRAEAEFYRQNGRLPEAQHGQEG